VSVLAFQVMVAVVVVLDGLLRPVGVDGAVVSGGGGLALLTVKDMVAEVVVLPAPSLAIAVMV
jgi:hypothetical protein